MKKMGYIQKISEKRDTHTHIYIYKMQKMRSKNTCERLHQ